MENSKSKIQKQLLKETLYQFLRLAGLKGKPSIDEIESSIKFLSELLKDYFGSGVYLLIDEYDAPLFGVKDQMSYQFILNKMRSILIHGIKYNPIVIKTVFTGILRLAKEEYLSVLNNFAEFGILDVRFANCFGFNQEEVDYLIEDTLKSSPHVDKKAVLEEIKDWYNGHNMSGFTLYNPWSIIKCLVNMKAKISKNKNPINAMINYWIDSGSNALAERVYTETEGECEIDQFLEKNSAMLSISRSIDYQGGVFLKTTLNSLLFHTGYITIDEGHKGEISFNISDIEKQVPILCKIPNSEVKNYLLLRLLSIWTKKKFMIDITTGNLSKLLNTDIEDKIKYELIIKNVLLLYEKNNKTEADFCSFLVAAHKLPYFKNKKHNSYLEFRTEDGKYVDTVYVPIEGKSKTGVIHELKKQNQEDRSRSVASLVEDAFWQIYANRYMSVLFKILYVERIIVRAIVFYKNSKDEWDVEMQEHIFSIKKAKKIDNFFSEKGKVLANSKELIKDQNAREEFLKKEIVDSLDALIAKNS